MYDTTFYDILEVKTTASQDEIRKAYKCVMFFCSLYCFVCNPGHMCLELLVHLLGRSEMFLDSRTARLLVRCLSPFVSPPFPVLVLEPDTHYRRLAVRWHPDKNRDNIVEAEEKFKKIAEVTWRDARVFLTRLGHTLSSAHVYARVSLCSGVRNAGR